MPPILMLHFSAGALALLTGVTALVARKGSRLHRGAGTVFFVVMLTTAGSGVYMGLADAEINFAIAGAITLYLLITGWMSVKRKEGAVGAFELGSFVFAAAGAVTAFYFAIRAVQSDAAMLGGVPYLVFASIITLAALSDLSVLLRRGLAGRQRIARHLWRMHLGFAAAVGSFFPGQLEIFPQVIREIRPIIVLFTPPFAVLGLMFFWLVYVWLSNRFSRAPRTAA